MLEDETEGTMMTTMMERPTAAQDATVAVESIAWNPAYMADGALEAYALVRADYTGGGGAQSVTVVTGTGGPHVEAVCRMDGAGSFTVEGYWGSDRVSRHGTSQAFEAWCDDYVSGLAYGWGE